MNLSNRIKSLRLSENLTQEEFGKKFGIVKSTVSLYENGKSTPNDQIKKQICDYFHVSLDYLLGNSDIKEVNRFNYNGLLFFKSLPDCKKKIYARMKELLISEKDFMREINIDLEKDINIDDLIIIAQKLNISIDYLLGISKIKYLYPEKIDSLQNITERERNILNTFRKLDEDNQDIIIGKAKELLKEQRYDEFVATDEPLRKTGTDSLVK